jgi:hypothetical protein
MRQQIASILYFGVQQIPMCRHWLLMEPGVDGSHAPNAPPAAALAREVNGRDDGLSGDTMMVLLVPQARCCCRIEQVIATCMQTSYVSRSPDMRAALAYGRAGPALRTGSCWQAELGVCQRRRELFINDYLLASKHVASSALQCC